MSQNIEVSAVLPAPPERVYRAWLSGDDHTRMTGGIAQYNADGTFTAWDNYITGRTLETVEGERIVQSWRTSEFPEDAPDSTLEVLLQTDAEGTHITLRHSNIPDGQAAAYRQGWIDHYFVPMTAFLRTVSRPRVVESEPVARQYDLTAAPTPPLVPTKTLARPPRGKRRSVASPSRSKKAAKARKAVKQPAGKLGSLAKKKPAKASARPAAKRAVSKKARAIKRSTAPAGKRAKNARKSRR